MDGLFELSGRHGGRASGAAYFKMINSDGSTPVHSHGLQKVGGQVEGGLLTPSTCALRFAGRKQSAYTKRKLSSMTAIPGRRWSGGNFSAAVDKLFSQRSPAACLRTRD
jgi:hypothetical protein